MSNKRIYVVAPAYFKTGGTELAHQLVHFYNQQGIDATIAYVGAKQYENPLNPAFTQYVTSWVYFELITDSEENVVIFPETCTEYLLKFKSAQKIIWWMSVDNYLSAVSAKMLISLAGILRAAKAMVLGGYFKRRSKKKKGVYSADGHLYQSEYAKRFLEKLGAKNILPLSDYINDSYFVKTETEKQNNVMYNPKKGYRFTRKIISKSPQLHWVPIENMTTQEVAELCRKSKVYIDFGNHPGKDRFPREAAISDCCVITGKRGAAENDIDVRIKSKYKFQDKRKNISAIIKTIEECLNNYEECISDFEEYRKAIKAEKKAFEADALKVAEHFGFHTTR